MLQNVTLLYIIESYDDSYNINDVNNLYVKEPYIRERKYKLDNEQAARDALDVLDVIKSLQI
jgi:hypothetical protein